MRSFTTVDSQVVFGRPMGRFTGFTKWRSDCLAGVSDEVSLNGMWVRSYKDSLDIVRGQFTRITLRSSRR